MKPPGFSIQKTRMVPGKPKVITCYNHGYDNLVSSDIYITMVMKTRVNFPVFTWYSLVSSDMVCWKSHRSSMIFPWHRVPWDRFSPFQWHQLDLTSTAVGGRHPTAVGYHWIPLVVMKHEDIIYMKHTSCKNVIMKHCKEWD